MAEPLRIGLGSGRVLDQLRPLFRSAGVDLSVLETDKRRLLHPLYVPGIGQTEILVIRAADVLAYVEHGVCALGVAGYDAIAEHRPNLLVPLDLKVARCRLAVAAPVGVDPLRLEAPRIATKFPRLAGEYFLERGSPAEIIVLSGAIEVAPLVGLADAIVDVVETGETLRRNGLEEKSTILEISARLVVNRAALKLRTEQIRALEEGLRRAIAAQGNAEAETQEVVRA